MKRIPLRFFFKISVVLVAALLARCSQEPDKSAAPTFTLSRTDSLAADSLLTLADSLAELRQDTLSLSIAMQAMDILKTGIPENLYSNWRRFILLAANNTLAPTSLANEFETQIQRLPSQEDSTAAKYFSQLGYFLNKKGKRLEGTPPLEKALGIFEKNGMNKRLPGTYNNLANNYTQLGDYGRAEAMLEKALPASIAVLDTSTAIAASYGLGRMFNASGRWEKALTACQQSLELMKGKDDGSCHACFARALLGLEKPDEAIRQASVAAKTGEPEYRTEAYEMLGRAFSEKKDYPAALRWLGMALDSSLDLGDQRSAGKAAIFMGDAWLGSNKADSALHFYQQSLGLLISGFQEKDVSKNPSEQQLYPEVWLMEVLRGKGKAWMEKYESSSAVSHLESACQCFDLATRHVQLVRSGYSDQESKFFLNNYAWVPFFEKSLNTSLLLFEKTGEQRYLEAAFHCAQQSKAGVLKSTLDEERAMRLAAIPDVEIEQLKAWERQLGKLKADTTFREDSIFQLTRRMDEWRRSHRERFPNYAAFARSNAALTAQEIQKRLPEKTLLIEYFLSDTSFYSFAISKTAFKYYQLVLPPDFNATLSQYLRSLSDVDLKRDSAALAEQWYLTSAARLYELLLRRPLEDFPGTKRLMVVPDRDLCQLSLTSLLTQAHKGSWEDFDLPVLLRNYSVSYGFSSAMLSEFSSQPLKVTGKWMGFGADYGDAPSGKTGRAGNMSTGFSPLPHARAEVEAIARLNGGDAFVNEEATKSRVFSTAEKAGMLHFAMHTEKDSADFWLAFPSPGGDIESLTGDEIAGLRLRAGLTVLSACNTGAGKLQRGEGVLSLARAFTMAGCEATVANHWRADDRVSREVMMAFYKHLKQGLPKDVALQRATLEYLDGASSTLSSPGYWANFVVMGEVRPLSFGGSRMPLALAAAGVLVLFLAWRFWIKK